MTTCAILAEYNPFHSGHAYHIRKIREAFGDDTRVIAIMSGNFVERGDVAVADKLLRAQSALLCGANLVLELPFPFSMLSAELFASAGVHIACRLGVCDVLSFGSESGDLPALLEATHALLSPAFGRALQKQIEKSPELGHPALSEAALAQALGRPGGDLFSPNNILALEYLKAIRKSGSRLIPHTIRRVGQAFSDGAPTEEDFPSATALRAAIAADPLAAIPRFPAEVRPLYWDALRDGAFPCSIDALSNAILAYFRLSSPDPAPDIHDAAGGLYTRLRNASFEATHLSALLSLAKTKKYTDARLRRAVLCSFFGVTSSEAKEPPAYTQLLAADAVGLSVLRDAKEASDFPILTKPSATVALTDEARRQKDRADRADAIFALTSPRPTDGKRALRMTPKIR